MTPDPAVRQRVLDAAAEVLSERSVATARRRDIAERAGVSRRSVTSIAPTVIALLAEVLQELPFPPIAADMARLASEPAEPALQALLRAARDVLGDPGAAWDPLELQAVALCAYDDGLREVVAQRLDERWQAAEQVVRQLRGAPGEPSDDAAAALHLIAVGLGLAMLAPVAPRWSDARAWTALAARLLQVLASTESVDDLPSDQRWRARVTIPADSMATVQVLHTLSLLRVRVVSLFTSTVDDDRQLLDMFLTSTADVDRATIVHGLASVGSDVIVTYGRDEDAVDIATRVLHLSALLIADPARTPQAAAELVLADSWQVADAAEGQDSTDRVLRLQWTPERHVILHRVRAPFTRTERNRASALLDLVAALAVQRGDADGYGWREVLRDGRVVTIRLSRPADTATVQALHERCSEQSRYERYFTPMNTWREENLRRVSGGHRGATLVVTDDADTVIALGNVFPAGPAEADTAEIAVLVDDAWHGRGVGAVLTERLIDVARRMGFTRLIAYVLATNRPMRALLGSSSIEWRATDGHDLGPAVVCLTGEIG